MVNILKSGDVNRLNQYSGGAVMVPGVDTAGELRKVNYNPIENTVVVKQPSDLENIDSTKNYMIDGVIDMGTTSIVVPPSGLDISGLNGARDTSKLISSADNYTLFTTEAGSYSGDLLIESLSIEVTGTNSGVFGLDNDGNSNAVDISGINFNNCTGS